MAGPCGQMTSIIIYRKEGRPFPCEVRWQLERFPFSPPMTSVVVLYGRSSAISVCLFIFCLLTPFTHFSCPTPICVLESQPFQGRLLDKIQEFPVPGPE